MENLSAIVVAVLVGAVIVGVFLLMGLVGRWIVGPMDRAARDVQAPAQFFTVDLFGLAVLLQVATLPTAWMLQIDEGMWNTAMGTGIFTWTASTAIWWASTQSLSRAGVGRPLKRIVFSTLVLPFTLVCIVGISFGNFVLMAWVASGDEGVSVGKAMLFIAANAAMIAAAYAGRRTTHWILSHPSLGRQPAPAGK